MKNKPKIGWVLTGNYTLASSRLQGYRVHDHLVKNDYDSTIIVEQFSQLKKNYSLQFFKILRKIIKEKYDVVFFQKPEWMMFKMSEMLRLRGIKTIAIQCDLLNSDYKHYFDTTILTTAGLKSALNLPDALVIDDMLEVPDTVFKKNYNTPNQKIRAVWVGQGTGPGGERFIVPFIEKLKNHPQLTDRYEFITISRGDWVTHQWSLDTVFDQITDCDVAILPLPDVDAANVKSTNRLTMFMALGMPVIASPIPAYLNIAQDNDNAFIAKDVDEFAQRLNECSNEETRSRIGQSGRKFSQEHFSPNVLGKMWENAISETALAPVSPLQASFPTYLMSRLAQVVAHI